MWRLLSGIALILLLDIVFIWMMAGEPDVPEIARAVGPTAAVPIIHPQETTPPLQIEDADPPEEFDVEIRRESGVSRVSKRSGRRTVRPFGTNGATMSVDAPENIFPDRIIWIGRTEVPVKFDREPVAIRTDIERNEDVQAEVVEERPTKKRSFQSKAISVIKKPYELMKAFADKFN